MPSSDVGPNSEVSRKGASDCGSGVHRVACAVDQVPATQAEWDDLVDAWERAGYGSEPPRCMAEYAEELIVAIA